METPRESGLPARLQAGDRLCQNPRLSQQVLDGKAVILNYEGRRILGLNGNGTLVWSLLDGRRTLAEITEEVAARTGVPAASIRDDVLEFVGDLRRRDLVTETGPDARG